VWIATVNPDGKKMKALESEGAVIIGVPEKNGRVDLKELMRELGKREIVSVLLEGGATLFTNALEEGLVDRIALFYAPIILGGAGRYSLVHGEGVKSIDRAIRIRDFSFTPMTDKPAKFFSENIFIEGYINK
jgi:diaminohydroxyphosphoribosylaminopyrimidine deaminase/5-amino-6-(5-phosphoribosylamino)uracil reductase